MRPKKYFFGTDPHVKMRDGKVAGVDLATNNAVVQFLEQEGPWDGYIGGGDTADFNVISSHNLGNLRAVHGESIQGEYRAVNAYLTQHWTAAGKPKFFKVIEGNHDYRIERYIDAHPELEGILEMKRNLPDFVDWIPFWSKHEILTIGKATFIHGQHTTVAHPTLHLRDYGTNVFYGHCVSDDSEVLTLRGWKRREELHPDDSVATLNLTTGCLEFQKFTALWQYENTDYPELLHFKNKFMDFQCTPDHGMVIGNDPEDFELVKAHQLENTPVTKMPVAVPRPGPGVGLTDDQLRLCVWIAADGAFENKCSPGVSVRWHFKKERKIQRVSELLTRLGILHSKKAQKRGTVKIYAKMPDWVSLYLDKWEKHLPQQFIEVNADQARVIVEEEGFADGSWSGSTMQFTTSKESEADLFQAIALFAGMRSSKIPRSTGWIVSVGTANDSINVYPEDIQRVPNPGKVWCLTVPNGTLVFRRNGKVLVTQNTHDMVSSALRHHGSDNTKVAHSMGCLCDYNQEYMRGRPTKWQQGFGVFYFWPDGKFNFYPVMIFDHSFLSPSGKFYSGRKRPDTKLVLV